MLSNLQLFKFGLVATVAVSLAACESSGSYRLASVGSVPDTSGSSSGGSSSGGGDGSSSSSSGGGSSSSGGTASSGGGSSSSSSGGVGTLGGNILVTAGNTVIGVAGKQRAVVSSVDGVVTRILYKTGQTLVNVGNGNTLILGKAGGKIGDLLRIDLGSKTVIGAPSGSPLLGVGVLSPAGSGNLLDVTVGKTIDATAAITQPLTGNSKGVIGGAVSTVTDVVGGVAGGNVTGTGGGLVNGVATTVTGTVGGLTGAVTPNTGSGTTTNSGLLGGVTNTVTGVVGGLKTKKK